MTRIAVAGGTGAVGRLVVDAARAAGHQPVVLARSVGIDITDGTGLDDALQGVSAVIDVSNVGTTNRAASIGFFEAATRRLLDAGVRAGVSHHVALSIVGIDRVPLGYYAGKQRQEDLLLAGDRPASVLRATQFHEFAGQVMDRIRGPFAAVPRMRSQPIAAREVAEALVDLAVEVPAGMAPELAGPEQHEMTDLARLLLQARGSHRLVVPVRIPGAAGRAMAAGGLLPTGDGPRGTETFAAWLARTTGVDPAEPRRPEPRSSRP